MLEKIDNLFLKISGWCIDFAYFFGINRKKLAFVIGLTPLIGYSLGTQFTDANEFKINLFFIFLFLAIIAPTTINDINTNYREDDVLPEGPLYCSISYRLFFNICPILIVLTSLGVYLVHKMLPISVIIFLIAPDQFFYAYIILNQKHKSKYRLKNLLRLFRRRISAAVRWQPAPTPLPQPINIR